MFQNTKLLIIASFLIVTLGLGFLWFGFKPASQSDPSPSTFVEEYIESTASAAFGIEGEKGIVVKVIDGDTIELATGQTVRFVGIDTPETKDPRRPVGCFGKEASSETKKILLGKEIIMQMDVSEQDKYQRLLRYIYLPQEGGKFLFVNDYLVRAGFAKAYTYPPDVKYNAQFLEAEKAAREGKLGLWGRCDTL